MITAAKPAKDILKTTTRQVINEINSIMLKKLVQYCADRMIFTRYIRGNKPILTILLDFLSFIYKTFKKNTLHV